MTAKRATNGTVTGSGVSCRSGDKLGFATSVSGEGCIVDEVSEVRLFSSGTIKKVCWAITVGPRELDEETYATYSPGTRPGIRLSGAPHLCTSPIGRVGSSLTRCPSHSQRTGWMRL